jgi:branched-chain amino acid transport system substrate-binding protein
MNHLRIGMLFAAFAVVASTAGSRAAETPYEIDAIMSRSGPYAFQGAEGIQALSVIENMTNKAGGINGRPIKFVIWDDQSNPATAVQAANAIIAKHAAVAIGLAATSLCSAEDRVHHLYRCDRPRRRSEHR